jgi:hypothetical protein
MNPEITNSLSFCQSDIACLQKLKPIRPWVQSPRQQKQNKKPTKQTTKKKLKPGC